MEIENKDDTSKAENKKVYKTYDEAHIDLLINIEKNLKDQGDYLRQIRGWIVFFGVLTILGLVLGFCSAFI